MAARRLARGGDAGTHRIWAAVLVLLRSVVALQDLPYVPTQILMPKSCIDDSDCDGQDVAFIFSSSDSGVDFATLNFSQKVEGNTQVSVTTGMLPFLKDDDNLRAFGAARTEDGSVVVYAGDCDSETGEIWKYTRKEDKWHEEETEKAKGDHRNELQGPYFLGGTLAFSSTLAPKMDQPTVYTYGGMCPTLQSNEDHASKGASTLQLGANYTKYMMSATPNGRSSDRSYVLDVSSTSGPRNPMAGFTLTGLAPSVSNISGTVTQQASYVLLGGHTQQAFINMSTAAVWKLPEESWTYVSVMAPDAGPSNELAVKNLVDKALGSRSEVEDVYSRSGHSAVLSEDGKSIVVLGGWVGSLDTPAEPQLAVLEMSQTYSDWQWRIPDEQPDMSGIYGHGAAVLPGNVMMVYGGWEIGESNSGAKRRSPTGSFRFLNLTSMAWEDSYSNPNRSGSDDGSHDAPGADSSSSSSKARRLGLGLGLGLGLAFILAIIAAGLCYWRSSRRKERRERDEAVRALAQDASQFMHDHDEMEERDDFAPWNTGGWYTGGEDPYQNGERSLGYESLRGGRQSYYNGGLSPPAAARKPVGRPMRGGYVPAAANPPTQFMSTPGYIHPIIEDDEEDYPARNNAYEPHTPISEEHNDPFLTPTTSRVLAAPSRASSTPSPEGRRHDPEVQDWVSDVDAADALLARMNTRHGRTSPTRRGSNRSSALRDDESRSGSNLSDSNRSFADSLKMSSPTRKLSVISPGGYLGGSTLVSGSGILEAQKPGSSSSSSYNTAKSTFGALQAEGPSLLMGRSVSPGTAGYDEDEPGSPSKSKPRRSWFGSLKRVFSTSESTSPATSLRDESPRRPSFEYNTHADYEPRLVGLNGELLRRKQGRQDWEGAGGGGGASPPPPGDSDWDIERAVEQRLVQVMFTVPKERLRVVNADDVPSDEEPLSKAQTAELVDPEKEALRVAEEAEIDVVHTDAHDDDNDDAAYPRTQTSGGGDAEKHGGLLLLDPDQARRGGATLRLSENTDVSSHRYSADLFTAQAVPLEKTERPRTRVLQMVDTIETKSRESSPGKG